MEDSAVQQAAHLLSWTGHHKLWEDFVQANSCTETPRNFRAQGSCKGVVPFSHQSCCDSSPGDHRLGVQSIEQPLSPIFKNPHLSSKWWKAFTEVIVRFWFPGWGRRLQGTDETKPQIESICGLVSAVPCSRRPIRRFSCVAPSCRRARKSLRYIGVVYHDYSDPRSCVHNGNLKGTSRRSRVINLSQISPTIPTLTPAKRPTAMWIRGSTAAEIRGNAWSTLQVDAQVFQHQNVSPNSFNIETPTKTHLAPVFWTTVLLTRPQIPQTTELCFWRVDMAHGHTCF